MTRVLVLTTEPLPYRGLSTTGAGLRAWGLYRGLAASGLDVIPAMPTDAIAGKTIEDPSFSSSRNLFSRNHLTDFVNEIEPDVIVFQHWGLIRHLQIAPCPIALDLAGPHLLERYYWRGGDDSHNKPHKTFDLRSEEDLAEKLQAIRRVDFVTCSGNFQRLYFLPYMTMAGYSISNETLPVIPFSIDPSPPEGVDQERVSHRFVYGGMFLPWQNAEKPLRLLLEILDETGKGELCFYGGMHPSLDVSGGRYEGIVKLLSTHPRVTMRGILPFEELCREYCKADVALDLFLRNPEREIAFTTRTVVYMWCGLPVIYNNYSELSGYIKDRDAGWTLDPDDEKAFRRTLQDILEGREDLEKRREAAGKLVLSEFDWTKTVLPLAKFCHNPRYREGKTGKLLAFENRALRIRQLEKELEETRGELMTLKGKLWFRMYEKLHLLRPLAAPIVFLSTVLVSLFAMGLFMIADFIPGKRKKSFSPGVSKRRRGRRSENEIWFGE